MFFQAFSQADFFGKLIFVSLFILSCGCWFFLIHKIWIISEIRKNAKYFQKAVKKQKETLLDLDLHQLPRVKRSKLPHPFGHLYIELREKTIAVLDKNQFFARTSQKEKYTNYLSLADMESIESHLHSAITRQKNILDKNLFILSTTFKLAPFLGLLGTVWGILITFGELQSGHGLASNRVILGGLSTALTTTVLGLLIAIPALIGYNYLRDVSRRFSSEMVEFGHFLLSTLEMQYRKADIV